MSEAEHRKRPPEAHEPQRRILRDYIAEPTAAIELGIDKRTLRKWRRTGEGPPGYVRIGHRFFYRAEVIEAWLRSREAKPVRQARST
jgi:Helix-turn-helix domain